MTGPGVVLVGAPGAGKTTVGALVAEQAGRAHLDTDALVERLAGASVAEIFVNEGEERFRELERRAVADALRADDSVVSTGGGAVLAPATRTLLRPLPVVWLQVGLSAAAPRVGLDAPRPLLAVQPRVAWRALMRDREPLYAEVATHVVATDNMTPQQVADRVVEVLGWDR